MLNNLQEGKLDEIANSKQTIINEEYSKGLFDTQLTTTPKL